MQPKLLYSNSKNAVRAGLTWSPNLSARSVIGHDILLFCLKEETLVQGNISN